MRRTQRNAKIHPRRKPKMQSSRTDGEPSSTQSSEQDSGQPEDAKTATPRERDQGQPESSTQGAVQGMRDSRQLEYPSQGTAEGRASKETQQWATRKPSPEAPAKHPRGNPRMSGRHGRRMRDRWRHRSQITRLDGTIDDPMTCKAQKENARDSGPWRFRFCM
jgi:hypothetical protein